MSTNHIGRQRPAAWDPPPRQVAAASTVVSLREFDKWLQRNNDWKASIREKVSRDCNAIQISHLLTNNDNFRSRKDHKQRLKVKRQKLLPGTCFHIIPSLDIAHRRSLLVGPGLTPRVRCWLKWPTRSTGSHCKDKQLALATTASVLARSAEGQQVPPRPHDELRQWRVAPAVRGDQQRTTKAASRCSSGCPYALSGSIMPEAQLHPL